MSITVQIVAWFVLLVFVYRSEAAVYLKSATPKVNILEGEELTIKWIAYNEDERIPPCHWEYAVNDTDRGRTFMAYDEYGDRYEYEGMEPWHFTKTQEPCSGGIRKWAKLKDSGIYVMMLDTGHKIKREDSQTVVKVYSRDLKFSVAVNGKVNNLDLSGGSHLKLPVLKTDKPVNVSIKLSGSFPPSTVTITRDAGEMSCDNMHEMCDNLIDLKNATNAPIAIRIKTGIVGADPVIISQPVVYSVPNNNAAMNAAVVFGVLFFLLLIVLIIIIVLLIVTRRKIRKQMNADKLQVKPKKTSTIQGIKSSLQSAGHDLITAFSVKRQVSLYGSDTENGGKEFDIRKCLKDYKAEESNVKEMIVRERKSVKDLLARCEKLVKDEVSQHLPGGEEEGRHEKKDFSNADVDLKSTGALKTDLMLVSDELERCESNLKEDNSKMRQIGLHTADRTSCNMNDEEDINENEHGDESRKENDDTADNEDASLEKLLERKYSKSQEILLEYMLTNLGRMTASMKVLRNWVKNTENRLNDIEKM